MSEIRSVHANILAGPDVLVLEMSRRELLLEADVRLTPGAGICLNVTIGDANYLAGGRVTRVDATLAGGQVRYRAGVALDNEIPAFDQVGSSRNAPAEASRTPPVGVAEEQPMDAAQEHQILKTALRSAEAARKDLAEELHVLHGQRARWEEERRALEQRVAQAESKVDAAARQLNAGKDAAKKSEQVLVAKHAADVAAWDAERKKLIDAARQGQAIVKQADTKLKESDARFREADAKAKQAEARIAELEARVKAADAKTAAAEARTTAAEAKAPAADARAAAAETKVAAAEARIREMHVRGEQLARDLASAQERERNTSAKLLKAQENWNTERGSLEERARSAETRVAELSGELTVLRESEQRLQKEIKAEEAKVADLVQENERQIEEMDALRASVKAEQARVADLVDATDRQIAEIERLRATIADAQEAAARHEQDKQAWAAQKERLTARLQMTEKWCADQQDLLHSLQQHLAGAATLLDGWKPAPMDTLSDMDKPAKNGRKATA